MSRKKSERFATPGAKSRGISSRIESRISPVNPAYSARTSWYRGSESDFGHLLAQDVVLNLVLLETKAALQGVDEALPAVVLQSDCGQLAREELEARVDQRFVARDGAGDVVVASGCW